MFFNSVNNVYVIMVGVYLNTEVFERNSTYIVQVSVKRYQF